MIEMTPERWEATLAYLREVFVVEDEQLATLMPRAIEAGLPNIAVSSEIGSLLKMFTAMSRPGGARFSLEVGALAGYSAMWIARGLADNGRLITLEPEDKYAGFAEEEFQQAGLAERIDVRRARAPEALDDMRAEFGVGAFDFVFLDAIKQDYIAYFERARELLAPSGVLTAHNALGAGSWWIDAAPGEHPGRDAIDRFNRVVAADPEFESMALPLDQGLLVARRLGAR